ncbi:MAG: PAS domain S-box protein [Nitrosomonadales bacterium]|nr:PAS domain S-box protein [Nitrosomonadales bacterium]
MAVEGAGDGVWDWDIASGEMPLSGHYEGMLGYAKGELEPTIAAWVNSVHPDDLPGVQANMQEYLAGRIPQYHIELRLRCKNGGYKWILCRGAVVARDAEGKPTRMMGIHTDIQQRKQMEEELHDSRMRMSKVLSSAQDAIVMMDTRGNISLWNEAAERTFGYSADEVLGKYLHHVIVPPRYLSAFEAGFTGFRASGTGAAIGKVVELVAVRKDGCEIPVEVSLSAVQMQDGWHAIGMLRDIATRKHAEAELRDAKEDAEAANRAKSEFLSSMSHELRTPLNAVLGFSQLLEINANLDAEQRDSVHEIIKAGRHLLELVNEVLDLAKIEAGRIDLSLEPVALAGLVDECCNLVKPLAEQRGITIACSGLGEHHVRADRVRLKQVLLNLLSNAIKYNRERGSIALEAHEEKSGCLRLSVRDTGKGIAAELLGELFQPFHRLEAEHSAIEGTGIGLTITRKLIEMMGGSIGVESTVNVGSIFWIELPEMTSAALPAAEQGMRAGQSVPARMRTVLYIEDNPVNMKLVAQIFAQHSDLQLLTAHEPRLGLELAKARRPDLVLLDINMPGMDGYQVLRQFKSDATLAAVPVIAVTANALTRDVERGMQAGFTAYITKPLQVESFIKAVEQALKN